MQECTLAAVRLLANASFKSNLAEYFKLELPFEHSLAASLHVTREKITSNSMKEVFLESRGKHYSPLNKNIFPLTGFVFFYSIIMIKCFL